MKLDVKIGAFSFSKNWFSIGFYKMQNQDIFQTVINVGF